MVELSQEAQRLDPTALISMFVLDMSSVGGSIMRFTRSSHMGGSVVFQGFSYEPADIEFSGLEVSGIGALPTPKVRIQNTNGAIQAIVNTYGDLNGCSLSRFRTFARFLDGEVDADPNAFFGPDQYRIERKSDDNADFIEWELSTSIDQEGTQIPGRVIIANTCMWRYRIWDETVNGGAGGFDYTKAQCPYTGATNYDINNQAVANGSDDYPSRDLNCCKTRFGENKSLPFGGFPGVPKQ